MPEQTIRIMCPNLTCRKVLAVPESARGKTVRCRSCGSSIRIPMPRAAAPAAAAPAKAPATADKPKG